MPIGAADPGAACIVEQDKLPAKLVLIRSNALAKNAKPLVTVALLHISQHLIVRSVLFDDINHVLEHRRFARALWDGTRRHVRARRQQRGFHRGMAIVAQHRFGVFAQPGLSRHRDDGNGSKMLVTIEFDPVSRCEALARPDALEVRNAKAIMFRIHSNCRGIPASRDQPSQCGAPWVKAHHGDRILRAVANVEPFA